MTIYPDVPKDGKYHIDPSNPMVSIINIEPWYPPGLSFEDVLAAGNTAQIAKLTNTTVLKFVWQQDDNSAKKSLEIEHSILSALGNHKRITKYLGKHEHGLVFSMAAHGDVHQYLSARDPSETPEHTRKKWARQAAEALAFIHAQRVIHCDFHPKNLLVDERLDIQLCDFSGSIFGVLDGGAMESVRFFLPRDLASIPDSRSDIFALGSTMYFIMSNHEPYYQMDEKQVADCFLRKQFPDTRELAYGHIIEGCWKGKFGCAQDVVDAIPEDC